MKKARLWKVPEVHFCCSQDKNTTNKLSVTEKMERLSSNPRNTHYLLHTLR